VGSGLSAVDFVHLGSALSLRSFGRMGSGLSVLDFLHLGSSISLRSFGRVGSGLSAVDFVHLGSALSMRSFGRMGSGLSVLDFLHLGSSLSLRSFCRMGSITSLSDSGVAYLGNSYLRYNSGIDAYVGGNRALSMSSGGGVLHGSWSSEATVTTSDRRLKRDIQPVEEAVRELHASRAGSKEPEDASLSWLLRALRPVAYRFKRGSEAKYQRFGFIADEVAALMPDLARPLDPRDTSTDPVSGLVYSDLIALLVAQVQRLESRLDSLERAAPPTEPPRTQLEDVLAQLQEQAAVSARQEQQLQEQAAVNARQEQRYARQEQRLALLAEQVTDLQSRCPAKGGGDGRAGSP
jgi:hypothetical protein